MHKRFGIFLFLGILLPALTLPVRASGEFGSIRVTLEQKDAEDGSQIELYLVAVPGENGYQILDSLGGGLIRQEDARSPYLAQWLSEMIGMQSGFSSALDSTGSAQFDDLAPGLYMVTQREASIGIHPYMVPLPLLDAWDLQVYPTADLITPQLPHTGDEGPWPYVWGMVLSGGGLILCGLLRRKIFRIA